PRARARRGAPPRVRRQVLATGTRSAAAGRAWDAVTAYQPDRCDVSLPYTFTIRSRPCLIRQARFDATGAALVRGRDPGRFRFRVFPEDVVIDPAEVVLAERNAPLLVRWR